MHPQRKNFFLGAAILSGLLSLLTPWLTISGNMLPGYGLLRGVLGNSTFHVTGLNGQLPQIFETPLRLVILIAMLASGFQLYRNPRLFDVPRVIEWVMALAAIGATTLPLLIAVDRHNVQLGIGWFLGMFCAVTPLASLICGLQAD